jgi:hypothetical protein
MDGIYDEALEEQRMMTRILTWRQEGGGGTEKKWQISTRFYSNQNFSEDDFLMR